MKPSNGSRFFSPSISRSLLWGCFIALAYAEQCLYASQYIENNPDIFRYDIEKRVNYWRQERNDALTLAQSIQSDNGHSFHSVVEQRESSSLDLCNHFFKIKNKTK